MAIASQRTSVEQLALMREKQQELREKQQAEAVAKMKTGWEDQFVESPAFFNVGTQYVKDLLRVADGHGFQLVTLNSIAAGKYGSVSHFLLFEKRGSME